MLRTHPLPRTTVVTEMRSEWMGRRQPGPLELDEVLDPLNRLNVPREGGVPAQQLERLSFLNSRTPTGSASEQESSGGGLRDTLPRTGNTAGPEGVKGPPRVSPSMRPGGRAKRSHGTVPDGLRSLGRKSDAHSEDENGGSGFSDHDGNFSRGDYAAPEGVRGRCHQGSRFKSSARSAHGELMTMALQEVLVKLSSNPSTRQMVSALDRALHTLDPVSSVAGEYALGPQVMRLHASEGHPTWPTILLIMSCKHGKQQLLLLLVLVLLQLRLLL